MSNPLFIRTSQGIINRDLIVFCGFYKNSKQIHINLVGGFSLRFEGDEGLKLLQMLTPSVVVGKSDALHDLVKDICSDPENEVLAHELLEGEK